MNFSIDLTTIFNYGIPIISIIIAYFSYKLKKDELLKNKEKEYINNINKIFPYIIDNKNLTGTIILYNKSDYPIFDIIIIYGINTLKLDIGESILPLKYKRTILPNAKVEIPIKHKGLGMSKFLVAGMFFRDYLGNEWFKDSYGKLKSVNNYKDMLSKKGLLFSPYSECKYIEK